MSDPGGNSVLQYPTHTEPIDSNCSPVLSTDTGLDAIIVSAARPAENLATAVRLAQETSTNSDIDDAIHLKSHLPLLHQLGDVNPLCGTIDAIVVPTIRPRSLNAASALAKEVGCALVVLCTTPDQAREAATTPYGYTDDFVRLVVWVPCSFQSTWLPFSTSLHPQASAATSSHADIARKRNAGMLMARLCGWRTILYLDDDIRGLRADRVARAASLTSSYRAVGFKIEDYPDNSTICHAYRLSGGTQEVFPGGSALIVDVKTCDSFFPSIYNEDWLFLFDAVRDGSMAAAGTLTQLTYDPFANPERAASEEFGDVIAEGLYRLIHEGVEISSATHRFWREVLRMRFRLLDCIASRLLGRDDSTAVRAQSSLVSARDRLTSISPESCVSFVDAWRADLDRWRTTLLGTTEILNLPAAATFLQLPVADELNGRLETARGLRIEALK